MKRIVLAASLFAALISAPASASVSNDDNQVNPRRCLRNPEFCAAVCVLYPDRPGCAVA